MTRPRSHHEKWPVECSPSSLHPPPFTTTLGFRRTSQHQSDVCMLQQLSAVSPPSALTRCAIQVVWVDISSSIHSATSFLQPPARSPSPVICRSVSASDSTSTRDSLTTSASPDLRPDEKMDQTVDLPLRGCRPGLRLRQIPILRVSDANTEILHQRCHRRDRLQSQFPTESALRRLFGRGPRSKCRQTL